MTEKSFTGSDTNVSKDGEKGELDLNAIRSASIGDVIEMVDTTNGQYHRSFTPHQVHVCKQFDLFFRGRACLLTGTFLDHLTWFQHRLRAIHRYRCCFSCWWPGEYGYCLLLGLHMRLGCSAVSL